MAEGRGTDDASACPDAGMAAPSETILPTVLHMMEDNTAHFKNDDSEYGQRLHSGFVVLRENMEKVTRLSESLRQEAHLYDLSPATPGNGFRSFNNIVHQAVTAVFGLCRQVCTGRDSLLFRKGHYVREVEAWGQTLASLVVLLEYIDDVLLPRCEDGNLLSGTGSSPDELMTMLNSVPQYSFYGRCLGFHYVPSLRKTLKYLNICLSAFSEVYYGGGNSFMQRTKNTVMLSSRYVVDAELRSRRIVDVVQYSSIDFLKTFWSVAETDIMTQLPGIVGPSLAVQQVVVVPCEEQQVTKVDGTATVVVPPPHSHLEARPITCHLLSAKVHEGMPGEKEAKAGTVAPPSDNLLIHCHGGGFVTQSTKAQEVFLREWATSTGVPILSIDYSLAPEAPYPRPLEEVLTVYCWVLNNLKILGCTGKKIVLTGDSAGGNLITGLTIKCLELGIRPADGLFLAYTPFVFQLIPSPARLLAVMDPMLPLGFALRCLKAYAGVPSQQVSRVTTPGDSSQPTPSLATPSMATPSQATPSMASNITTSESNGPPDEAPPSQTPGQGKSVVSETVSDTESFVEVSESDVKDAEALVKSPSFHSEPGSDTLTTVSLTSEASKLEESTKTSNGVIGQKPEEKEERSRRYVAEFLEKYVLDSRTDKQGRKVPILRTGSEESEPEDETVLFEAPGVGAGITAKLGRARDAVVSGISAGLTSFGLRRKESVSSPTSPVKSPPAPETAKRPSMGQILMGGNNASRRNSRCSLSEEFRGVELLNDHYLSPLTAPKETLAKFPPCVILTVDYDFCLDDDVTMAKLLKSLGVPVTLDILEQLPHGFLSLSMVSQEAHVGCKKAIFHIKHLLGINEDPAPSAAAAAASTTSTSNNTTNKIT
ncbi:hormone-sensitive lipase-like isoform X2 [Eriocheir sinensis]|uniref:hormone-sensitive lipase-like isoform X2 n=1 Tax=Eriocheir sinensis TaxID=95602 RepID=UPI0021C69736|nr:hormone-sensitive lipase-like isoform X2 [Eriocheir sinensis]